jgi:hypothetical protein
MIAYPAMTRYQLSAAVIVHLPSVTAREVNPRMRAALLDVIGH